MYSIRLRVHKMSQAKFEVISKLQLFEPTCREQGGETITTACTQSSEHQSYYVRSDEDFVDDEYHHFPFVLRADGSLWEHANLFLLEQIKSVKRVPSKTLETRAVDLVMFRRWLDNEDVNYLEFKKRSWQGQLIGSVPISMIKSESPKFHSIRPSVE